MVMISLIMLPKVSVKGLFRKNKSGVLKVVLARIPNTVGMLPDCNKPCELLVHSADDTCDAFGYRFDMERKAFGAESGR